MADIFQHLGACPLCGRKLRADHVRVIRETARTVFAGAECPTCSASLLLAAIRVGLHQAGGRETRENAAPFATMIGMISDLTPSDARTLGTAKPLTADDVLALHRYLSKKGSSAI